MLRCYLASLLLLQSEDGKRPRKAGSVAVCLHADHFTQAMMQSRAINIITQCRQHSAEWRVSTVTWEQWPQVDSNLHAYGMASGILVAGRVNGRQEVRGHGAKRGAGGDKAEQGVVKGGFCYLRGVSAAGLWSLQLPPA